MTNLDIETFWAVVQHGTMTAAAEALYITQPTLSMRVRALEERVGTPLFVRSKGQRRIQLTDAGQKFLTLARRWQRLLSETDALSELEQRVYLRIAATYTTNQYILPAVYQRFLSLHLPVSLWIHTLRDVDSAQALLNHELDFALIDSNTVFNSQLEVRPIFRERFLLLSSPDSRYPAETDPAALGPDQARVCRFTQAPPDRINYLVTRRGEELPEPALIFLDALREHLLGRDNVQVYL